MVVLAVKLLPGDSSYYYKLGVSTEDIVQGKLKPNGLNATWISGTPDSGTVITGVYFSQNEFFPEWLNLDLKKFPKPDKIGEIKRI